MLNSLIRIVTLSTLCLTLAACSSTKVPDITDPEGTRFGSLAADGTITTRGPSGGKIQITYRKDGKWDSITSTGVARIQGDGPAAIDSAVTVATLRARAQMAELTNVKVTSRKSLRSVTDTLKQNAAVDSTSEADTQDKTEDTSKLTEQVIQDITQTSRAILSGTVVKNEYIDSEANQVLVTVYVDRRTSATAWSNK